MPEKQPPSRIPGVLALLWVTAVIAGYYAAQVQHFSQAFLRLGAP